MDKIEKNKVYYEVQSIKMSSRILKGYKFYLPSQLNCKPIKTHSMKPDLFFDLQDCFEEANHTNIKKEDLIFI